MELWFLFHLNIQMPKKNNIKFLFWIHESMFRIQTECKEWEREIEDEKKNTFIVFIGVFFSFAPHSWPTFIRCQYSTRGITEKNNRRNNWTQIEPRNSNNKKLMWCFNCLRMFIELDLSSGRSSGYRYCLLLVAMVCDGSVKLLPLLLTLPPSRQHTMMCCYNLSE